jgi:hypothetical protein
MILRRLRSENQGADRHNWRGPCTLGLMGPHLCLNIMLLGARRLVLDALPFHRLSLYAQDIQQLEADLVVCERTESERRYPRHRKGNRP